MLSTRFGSRLSQLVGLLAIGVLALVLAVACDDDDGNGGRPTPPPAPPATPAPAPEVTDGAFEYSEHGYAAQFPADWVPRFNFVTVPPLTTDAFFAPVTTEAQPNLSVQCEVLPEPLSLEEYVDASLENVLTFASEEPVRTPATVVGQEAERLRYLRSIGDITLSQTDYYFVTERCGWRLSLVTPLELLPDYEPTLEAFIASFRLLP